ncbi:lasso peptide biosynthesis B2 protein [Streptomyces sp. B1866]|uniref:lasso peptide biosynthesis B2 protein n=1 Tax=Streptomyces sp. B1866 TaxID=3075431 RepID=UPI0028918629|nr:lasso peptide biosynthesis B2 protein [Streptomyces sp. B1866]MDT3395843.1 lasso peptide biosynthesis B2 protein [Streptomyces sp. B1866]
MGAHEKRSHRLSIGRRYNHGRDGVESGPPRRTVRPATVGRARQAVHAVRQAAVLVPGRVACLEESAAAVVTLAASRERVTWCHGVAGDPIRLHAWVQVGGQPVAEPESITRYTPLRTI